MNYIEKVKEILPEAIQEKRLIHSYYGSTLNKQEYILEPKFTYKDWYICIPCGFVKKKGGYSKHFRRDDKKFIELLNIIKNEL